MKIKKYVIVGVIVVALLVSIAAVIRSGRRGEEAAPVDAAETEAASTGVQLTKDGKYLAGIKTVVLGYGSSGETLALSGVCEESPGAKAVVTAPVSGQIIGLTAKAGDRVRRGQTLARIASRDVAELQSALIRARAERDAATLRLRNIRAFAASGALTKKPLEEAQNTVTTDTASVKQAEAALARAKSGRTLAASDLERKKKLAAAQAYQARPVEDAKSAVAEAQAEFESTTSGLKVKKAAYDRTKRLLDAGLASRRDFESAEAELGDATAREKEARTHLEIVNQTLSRESNIAAQNLYTSAEVQQAESALQQAEQDVANGAAELERAQGHLRVSKTVLARETEIARKNLNANKEIQEAEATLILANGQVKATQNAINALRARGAGTATVLSISAPLGGVITTRSVTPGQAVESAAELFTILNTDTIVIVGNAYERDISRLRVGMPVRAKVNSYPNNTFSGTISKIDPLLDNETRTLKVRCSVTNRDGLLKPGMFAELTITTGSAANVLLVPETALQEDEGQKYVFVVDGPKSEGRYRKAVVQVGEASNGHHRVISGLKAGDEVVTEGSFILKSETKKSEMGED
ncbi:MAG: efflux RND transporter periplasmic adaptor subunit [Armatimonadota bacterium]